MIKQAGIDFRSLPDEAADNPLGEYSGAGTIFGATGGVMTAALRTAYFYITGTELGELNFREIEGLDGIKEAEVEIAGKTIQALPSPTAPATSKKCWNGFARPKRRVRNSLSLRRSQACAAALGRRRTTR